MRTLAIGAMLVGASGFAGAQAQIPSSLYSGCPERKTIDNWCPAQLVKDGWKLKYETESPRDLADSYWRYQVWTRERLAVVCALVGGRGGIRINGCEELKEVDQ